jgi:hypothetical protein
MGAQPYYTVISGKGTIYSFSEDCLRSRGTSDPVFALQGSNLVTIGDIGDLTTTGTVRMLDVVDEAIEDVDDEYTDAEAGQDNVERAAAAAADDSSLAQQTVMMTNLTSRLQERDEAIQEQLRSQLEVVLAKQESAHQRIILAMSTHSADTSDAGVDSAQ